MTQKGVLDLLEIVALEHDGFEITNKMRDFWAEMLTDVSDELGIMAVKVVMLQSQFRPRVADVRRAALLIANPESEIDASQAWALISRAARLFGAYQAERALASLPPTVASAARRFGWNDLCAGDAEITRAHFLKMFAGMQVREKEIGVLPAKLQEHLRLAAHETGAASQPQIASRPARPAIASDAPTPAGADGENLFHRLRKKLQAGKQNN